jgi:hypothetical protein
MIGFTMSATLRLTLLPVFLTVSTVTPQLLSHLLT